MASQSLYRKWRSQTFNDLVGQEAVIRTLKNALCNSNLAHAYLFTGPRGTGKTSTARLLAKTINCLNPHDGEPCNECLQCREITAGSSFNVLEIDAASNRGIDSIRELREKVMMPPTTGKYKVYILDEAHMLTVEAFNALLKTLEEPPPHAIFVMATTDVHKMLPTVLSRCQRFDFKRITSRQIVSHLRFVAEQEHVELADGAAELLARAAAGGMRDALSLLDQAIAYSGAIITLPQVQAMLGVADPRAIQKLITFIADLKSPEGLHLIHELSESGADLRQMNIQVAEYWRAMMLARAGANVVDILDATDDEINEIMQLSRRFSLEELIESARIFAQNDLMQKSQATPQLGLELAFLSCVSLHQHGGTISQHAPVTAVRGGSDGVRAARQPAASPASRPSLPVEPPVIETPQERLSAPLASVSPQASAPPITSTEPVSSPQPVHELRVDVQQSPEQQHEAAEGALDNVQVSSLSPALTIEEVKEKWEYIRRRVRSNSKKNGSMISALLAGYAVVDIDGTVDLPIVVMKASADFHYNSLQKEEHHEVIRWALKIELQMECAIRLLAPHVAVSRSPGSQVMAAPHPTHESTTQQKPEPNSSEHGTRSVTSAVVSSAERLQTAQVAQASPRAQTVSVASTHQVSASAHVNAQPVTSSSAPIARKSDLRENTSVASARGETYRQTIESHARHDPIVQEVVRIFKAEIKDIHPK